MRIAELEAGERYLAKVSGKFTVLRVLGVREIAPPSGTTSDRVLRHIDVVNERTGQKTWYSSAGRFYRKATSAEREVLARAVAADAGRPAPQPAGPGAD